MPRRPPVITGPTLGEAYTGISTRLFATTGHPVIGIDPNADMLATARGPSTSISADHTPYLRIDHSISFHATRVYVHPVLMTTS